MSAYTASTYSITREDQKVYVASQRKKTLLQKKTNREEYLSTEPVKISQKNQFYKLGKNQCKVTRKKWHTKNKLLYRQITNEVFTIPSVCRCIRIQLVFSEILQFLRIQ